MGTLDNLNATCPFCGKDELRASIEERYRRVPLGADGFSTVDTGELVESEIHQIICDNCEKEVSYCHYTDHGSGGDPCDCYFVEVERLLAQERKAAGV